MRHPHYKEIHFGDLIPEELLIWQGLMPTEMAANNHHNIEVPS